MAMKQIPDCPLVLLPLSSHNTHQRNGQLSKQRWEHRTITKHNIAVQVIHTLVTRSSSSVALSPRDTVSKLINRVENTQSCSQVDFDPAPRTLLSRRGPRIKPLQQSGRPPPRAGCTQRAEGRGRERIKPPTFPPRQPLLHKAPLDSIFWVLDQIPESAQSIWEHLGSAGFAYRNRRHL